MQRRERRQDVQRGDRNYSGRRLELQKAETGVTAGGNRNSRWRGQDSNGREQELQWAETGVAAGEDRSCSGLRH